MFNIHAKENIIGKNLVNDFISKFTTKNRNCDVSIMGHPINTSYDFQEWLVRNNIVNAFSTLDIEVIEDYLNRASVARYRNLTKKLQPFINNDISATTNHFWTIDELLAFNLGRLANGEPRLYYPAIEAVKNLLADGDEFGSKPEECDEEGRVPHKNCNKLSVFNKDGQSVKAIALSHSTHREFWATDKDTRNAIEQLIKTDEFRWQRSPHLDNRVLVHIHPTTGSQTWLQKGDLLVRKTDNSGFYPLTREAALELGFTIKYCTE